MPILSDRDQSARRSILLTTGFGIVFGLFFGLPPALAARAMGVTWVPYGLVVILSGLAVGVSLAYLVVAYLFDMPYPRIPVPVSPRAPVLKPLRTTESRNSANRALSVIRRRLAEENVVLAKLDAERERLHDSHFGTTAEQRIVWGELLELELQDIDEQVNRIRQAAGDSIRNAST